MYLEGNSEQNIQFEKYITQII